MAIKAQQSNGWRKKLATEDGLTVKLLDKTFHFIRLARDVLNFDFFFLRFRERILPENAAKLKSDIYLVDPSDTAIASNFNSMVIIGFALRFNSSLTLSLSVSLISAKNKYQTIIIAAKTKQIVCIFTFTYIIVECWKIFAVWSFFFCCVCLPRFIQIDKVQTRMRQRLFIDTQRARVLSINSTWHLAHLIHIVHWIMSQKYLYMYEVLCA